MRKWTLACVLLGLSMVAQAKDVRFLSWNVFMLPKPIKYSLQVTRTKHIIQELKRVPHDIVLLQEAFDEGFKGRVRSDLKEAFPHQYYLPKEYILYPVMGSGVYVLSKLPFEILGSTYFNACGSADCLASKGALLLEFTLPSGEEFQIATTHLQSDAYYAHTRVSQLLQIKQLFREHLKALVPQLLIGDLNVNADDGEFRSVQALMQMDAFGLRGDLKHTFGFKNECYPTEWGKLEWIDHALIDSQGPLLQSTDLKVVQFEFETKSKKKCALSDHHAIEGEIRVAGI